MIIYLCTNKINGKMYVGLTKDLPERIKQHYQKAFNNPKFPINYALLKYGTSNFYWSVLRQCLTKKSAWRYEQYYIRKLKTYKKGYNLTAGGEGARDYTITPRDRTAISIAQKKRFLRYEERKRASNKPITPFNVYFKNTGKLAGTWELQSQCAKDLNLNQPDIWKCLHNKSKSSKGYVFRYCSDTSDLFKFLKEKNRHYYPNQKKFEVFDKNGKSLGIWASYSQCDRDLNIVGSARYVKGIVKSNKHGYTFKIID
jgi:group I intron endonuclease